jgi:hypothetical protein
MRWPGHTAGNGEKKNAYRTFVGRQERKRPLGRPRHRSKDIKIDLKEIQDRAVWIGLISLRTGTSGQLL